MPNLYRSQHAGTIADLMRQRGQIDSQTARMQGAAEAQRAQTSGQAWGGAIQNIGQGISGTLRDFAQQREDAPRRELMANQSKMLAAQLSSMEASQAQGELGRLAKMALDLDDPNLVESLFGAMAELQPEYAEPLQRSMFDPDMRTKVLTSIVQSSPGYEAPAAPKTRQIETVDEAGNPITSIVEDTPGQSFAQPSTATREGNPNREALAVRAAQGDQDAVKALEILDQKSQADLSRSSLDVQAAEALRRGDTEEYNRLIRAKREVGDAGRSPQSFILQQQSREDAEGIADAIANGLQPPQISARVEGPVRAALARKYPDLDLSRMRNDWQAMGRHVSALNSVSQLRLRQTAYSALNSLDYLDDVLKNYEEKGGGAQVKTWNQFQNWAAEQGLTAPEYTEAFRMLNALITDQESEVATVYRGGNSPTEQTLLRAAQNLNTSWSADSMKKMIDLNRRQLQLRLQAVEQAQAMGTAGNQNLYDPRRNDGGMPGRPGFQEPASTLMPGRTGTERMQAPDGSVQTVPADQVDHYTRLGAKVVP